AAVAEMSGFGFRIHRDANRPGAILGADPRRHAEARRRVDRGRVRGVVLVDPVLGHERQTERVDAIARQGKADHPARLLDHEVDHFGRDQLRRANEIAFVLAIFVVGDDDELAVPDRLDRLLYRSESHVDSLSKRCTYFPSMSASTCTRSPATSSPSV